MTQLSTPPALNFGYHMELLGSEIDYQEVSFMASGGKLSKTARASIGKDKDSIHAGKPCPQCSSPMVATRVIKSAGLPGGMYWVCPKDEYRIKT